MSARPATIYPSLSTQMSLLARQVKSTIKILNSYKKKLFSIYVASKVRIKTTTVYFSPHNRLAEDRFTTAKYSITDTDVVPINNIPQANVGA